MSKPLSLQLGRDPARCVIASLAGHPQDTSPSALVIEPLRAHAATGVDVDATSRARARVEELVRRAGRGHDYLSAIRLDVHPTFTNCVIGLTEYRHSPQSSTRHLDNA